MTKTQRTWLILGILAGVLTLAIVISSAIIAFSTWTEDWERELFDRSEAHLAKELGTEWVDAESISEYKDGKDYYCRAEVFVRVGLAQTYVVFYEKPTENGEWILVRYEKEPK